MNRERLDVAIKQIRDYTRENAELCNAHHFLFDLPLDRNVGTPEIVVMGTYQSARALNRARGFLQNTGQDLLDSPKATRKKTEITSGASCDCGNSHSFSNSLPKLGVLIMSRLADQAVSSMQSCGGFTWLPVRSQSTTKKAMEDPCAWVSTFGLRHHRILWHGR